MANQRDVKATFDVVETIHVNPAPPPSTTPWPADYRLIVKGSYGWLYVAPPGQADHRIPSVQLKFVSRCEKLEVPRPHTLRLEWASSGMSVEIAFRNAQDRERFLELPKMIPKDTAFPSKRPADEPAQPPPQKKKPPPIAGSRNAQPSSTLSSLRGTNNLDITPHAHFGSSSSNEDKFRTDLLDRISTTVPFEKKYIPTGGTYDTNKPVERRVRAGGDSRGCFGGTWWKPFVLQLHAVTKYFYTILPSQQYQSATEFLNFRMKNTVAPSSQYQQQTRMPMFDDLGTRPREQPSWSFYGSRTDSTGGGSTSGLLNLGNTCFFNAVLQFVRSQMSFVDELRLNPPTLQQKAAGGAATDGAATTDAAGAQAEGKGGLERGGGIDGGSSGATGVSSGETGAAGAGTAGGAMSGASSSSTPAASNSDKDVVDLTKVATPQKTPPSKDVDADFANALELYQQSCGVFEALLDGKRANPKDLLKCISKKNPLFGNHMQHDAHEFFLEYVNQLHDALLHRVVTLPTLRFDSEIDVLLTCPTCNEWVSSMTERFRDFSLDFPETHQPQGVSLEELLRLYFLPEEREYRCPRCAELQHKDQKLVTAQKQLRHAPRSLSLHLKRFKPDYVLKRYTKRKEEVHWPEVLDLTPHLSPETVASMRAIKEAERAAKGRGAPIINIEAMTEEEQIAHAISLSEAGDAAVSDPSFGTEGEGIEVKAEYKLSSIIAHHGETPHSGHYVTWVRSCQGAG